MFSLRQSTESLGFLENFDGTRRILHRTRVVVLDGSLEETRPINVHHRRTAKAEDILQLIRTDTRQPRVSCVALRVPEQLSDVVPSSGHVDNVRRRARLVPIEREYLQRILIVPT